jgi:hypothetical protein
MRAGPVIPWSSLPTIQCYTERRVKIGASALLLVATTLVGCAPSSRGTSDLIGSETKTLDAGGVGTKGPGCTGAPDCGGCADCASMCWCLTQNGGACLQRCQSLAPPPPPPPIPTEPVTLQMAAFDVAPGAEAFMCQSFTNPFQQDVAILTSESFMTEGSHHFFAFHLQGVTDMPLAACGGLDFHPYIHSAQVPHLKTTYPAGVGRFLPGKDGVEILSHYLNTTSDMIHADVRLVLTVVDPSTVPIQASDVFMNNLSLSIPPMARTTASKSCAVGSDIKLLQAASHMHQRGVHFTAKTDDGTVLYQTDSWSEPTPKLFDPPLSIPGGTNITWSCDYDNPTNTTFTFGQSAVTNEMCIFTGIYFPAPDGAGIECLF